MYRFSGSGNNGQLAWILQRVSGVAVAICGTIIFIQIALNGGHGFTSWLLLPVLGFGLWHAFSGFKMITDDYVSCTAFRLILQIFYWIAGIAVAVIGFAAIMPYFG
ncbi:MAG: succinate dehydrogenase [Deferribacteraceae bacterium]|jgi:succinate dehydrogenase / fumarate reductase membrane anchor subunit|nr:succinate dehydrogenase [Deferribacteraceae bacterium]